MPLRRRPSGRSGRRALLLLLFPLLLSSPASAQAPKPSPQQLPPEELRASVARRVRQLTGQPTRIGDLRYELLSSRFVGSAIEVGPRGKPLLHIGELVVELALLAAGLKIVSIEASEVRGRLPGEALEQTISPRPHRAAVVRSARVRGVLLLEGEGGAAELSGVEIKVRDLGLPAADEGDPFRATGALSIKVARVRLGDLLLDRVALEGRLQNDRLLVDRLAAEVLGGSLQLRGRVGLAGKRPGPVELRGTLGVSLEGVGKPLEGKVRLYGKSLSTLRLEGKLGGAASPAPQRGTLRPAPPVRLRLRVGRRELRGSAAAWELR